ncbi:T9SS type B sorting domain-containing protein [Solitalea koreensis]|uniref:T9SS type B sorting domain-containing protein n=1 Tax=Solitalea koreensis TaxID=543615 RepID=UPI00163DD0F8|nr:gliding motility-associated C-terminal domain-containing protein [Solitalea koreensis]
MTLLLVLFAKLCSATAPVITDLNKTGQPCETAIKFSINDFSSVFTDADGDAIGKIKILSLPAATEGVLKVVSTPVTVGMEISANLLDKLTFNVTSGFTGTSTFGFNIADAGGAYATITKNIKVTVPDGLSITNNVVATAGATSNCQDYFDPAPITESSAPVVQGGLPFNYQWQQSTDNVTYTDISGATAKDYDPPVIYNTTYYRRKILVGFCYNSSIEVAIIMYPPIANNGIHAPTSYTGCGSNTDYSAINGDLPSGGNGTYTYQWESSPGSNPANAVWSVIPGAVSKNFDPDAISGPTLLRRKVVSGQCFDYSSPLPLSPTSSSVTNNSFVLPQVNAVCGGTGFNPDPLMGTVAGGSQNYQWQQSYSSNGPWTNIPGETGKDFNPPFITQTTFYRRSIYANGCTDNSLPQAITIAPLALTNNSIAADQFISTGKIPALITGTQPSGGDGSNYSYLWEQSTNGSTWTSATGAANGKDYQPEALSATTYFRRNVYCGQCNSVSENVIITVGTVTITNNTISPNGVTETCGMTSLDPPLITGAVASSNLSFTYQWQQSTDGTTWQNITGATAKDYDPGIITQTTSYRRQVIAGAVKDANNGIAYVLNPKGIGGNTVTADQSIVANATPSLLLGSDPSTAVGQTFQYTWEKSTDGVNNWVTADGASNTKNYQPPALTVTTYYRRKVKLGTCPESISEKVKITISANVPISNNIIDPPTNIANLCGVASIDPSPIPGRLPSASATFTYQWEQSNDGTNWITIPGATDQNYDPGLLTKSTYFQRKVITSTETNISNKLAILISPVPLSSNTVTTNQDIDYGKAPFPLAGSLPVGGDGNYAYMWEQSANGKNNWTAAPDNNTSRNYQPPTLTSTTFYRRTVVSGACKSISDSVKIKVTAIVDLDLAKTAKLSESVDNGIDYSIKVLNKGPQDADSVIVRDTLATNIKYYAASTNNGTFTYDETTHVFTWTIGKLNNAETKVLKLIVEAFASETITNKASVTGKTSDIDPDKSNNQSTAVFPFVVFAINAKTLPNMITPNGDGKNDFLKFPQMDAFTDNELSVFDRWGNKVYSVKGYQNNWNGTGLSEGTYFYVLKVRVGGKIHQFKEYLTIVRNRFNG